MSTAPFSHKEKFRRILFRPILSLFYCTLLAAAIAIAILAPTLGKLR